jgi:diaminohydroxyphosphoribosylaminopyrimidine deaminase / 5-amino-6-(5-phosphoribosylamino)uracil reductase
MPASTPSTPDPFRFFRPGLKDRPFIVAQLGQSLDGRIATVTGDSKYIGSRSSLVHLHRIRAHVEAVVVGIGTVLADDPKLNVRHCEGPNPARIVIDAKGRLPATATCLDGADGARRIVFRAPDAGGHTLPDGVEIHRLPVNGAGRFDLAEVARALSTLGFTRVLLEGGAAMISQAIDAGIVDRLHLMVSPVLIGSGQPGLELAPVQRLAEARRPAVEVTLLGEGEVLFDCDLSQN